MEANTACQKKTPFSTINYKALEVSRKSLYSLFKRWKQENQAKVHSTTHCFYWTTNRFDPTEEP